MLFHSRFLYNVRRTQHNRRQANRFTNKQAKQVRPTSSAQKPSLNHAQRTSKAWSLGSLTAMSKTLQCERLRPSTKLVVCESSTPTSRSRRKEHAKVQRALARLLLFMINDNIYHGGTRLWLFWRHGKASIVSGLSLTWRLPK